MPVNRSLGRALGLILLAVACSRQSDPAPAPRIAVRPDSTIFRPNVRRSETRPLAPPRNPLALRVVYPALDDLVRVRDSSFLLGSVDGKNVRVTINGIPVRVWPNGAWLAWVPFPPDSVMQFRIEASTVTDSSVLMYAVRRDPRYLSREIRSGSAWIDSTSLSPQGQVWLPSPEYLSLSARAAEGSEVLVRLPGGKVIRLLPQRQAEAVLPALRAFDRDTNKLRTPDEVQFVGVVRGRTIGPILGPVLSGQPAPAANAPAHTSLRCATTVPCPAPAAPPDSGWPVVEAVLGSDTARSRWPLQVALLDTLPIVAELDDDSAGTGKTDSVTPGRAAPGGSYAWFFPTGTRAVVNGRVNDDLRVRLSPGAEAWVPRSDAQPLPGGLPEPHATVGSVTLEPARDRVTLRIPLTQRIPFQVTETERSLSIKFYGAVGDVDWMRYGADSLVRRLDWSQTDRDEVTLTVDLSIPIWGYRTRWSRTDLLLEIRRPPAIRANDPLRGRVIAVDPGHPPLGATGPTGLRESDANLTVATQLRTLLEQAGARVVMTRATDSAVDLWPRVAVADTSGAELLVSIHNNALPDGVNPFTNNGTTVFYNQPHSAPLAAAMQPALVRRLGLPDLGFTRADLALVRLTWMPSVLCEGMFIIMPDQEAVLRSSDGPKRYARGAYEGIRRFLQDRARVYSAAGVGGLSPAASPTTIPSIPPRAPDAGAPERGVAH